MQTFQGLAVSDGLTVGPVVRIDRGAAGLHRIVCDPFRERALYEAAIVLAKDELNRLQQHACGQDADILMFQIALLEDESFTNEIGDYIAAGAGSAAAVERAEQIFAGRLKNVDDDYIRERSVDVCDACRRVVDILDGRPSRRLHLTEPSILVAELFYPSDLFGQAPGMILGLASETDSETSHAAIMAR
ncbi:MAG: phosphoenolpyruvate-utilizing N-terminal domain-containing protein, partial [Gemmiger qucibialis]